MQFSESAKGSIRLLAVITDGQESYRATKEVATLYNTVGKCLLAVLPSVLGWCSHMQAGTVTASRFIASM